VSASTWSQLAASLDERQLMDLVFTVGAYALLAMAFNAFGVRPEASERALAERWGEGLSPSS
jgi:hypothetical protein